eukprot:2811287-Rhodomonas_salina.1
MFTTREYRPMCTRVALLLTEPTSPSVANIKALALPDLSSYQQSSMMQPEHKPPASALNTVDPPSAPPAMKSDSAEDRKEHEPTWFSDEVGNLKLVNFVVKRPCCSCFSVLLICLVMIVLLAAIVVGDGNFITNDVNDYDLYDVRSKAYDSFRLAKEAVEDKRDLKENAGVVDPRQSEALDMVYWIYEAQTDGGMFTKKALQDMKEADDIMLADKDWDQYCVLEHFNKDGSPKPEENVTCKTPLSATTIFFPESWDSALATSVVDRLKNEETVKLYNQMAPCLEHGVQCEAVMQGVPAEQQSAAEQLKADIEAITSKWTGSGELVQDPQEVALFCAYLKLLPTQAFAVDFYFDKNFNVENPVSMFSRTLLQFGGPVAGFNRTDEDKSDQEKIVKDYVLDNLYDEMEQVAKKSHSKETNTYYFMGALIFDVFIQILIADALKAIASVLLVFLYLWYMLGSLFLAAVGMAEIL